MCVRLYRRLARAYPHEFRLICGEEMELLGEDAAPRIWKRHGFTGLARLLADVALRLPGEYLSEFRQDVRYAFRRLRQSPGFTAVGVLSLAMGIGMCVAFFAQMYAVQRPIPGISAPAELWALEQPVPYTYFESYREQRQIAPAMMAFLAQVPFTVALDNPTERAERVTGHLVSVDYFSTLGVTPRAGRFFDPQSERPGSEPVVIISERFWRTRLNADPQAVGRTLRVNGHSAKVIGIGPAGFRGVFPMPPADVFVPVTAGADVVPELREDALHNSDLAAFRVVLRLAEGVTPSAAEAALEVVTRTLDEQKPVKKENPERTPARLLEAAASFPIPRERRTMMLGVNLLLLAMVLSLACANLAILLLARGSQRQREIAIRLSVGASRFRLVRQLLTESLILALVGGAAGLGLFYALAAGARSLAISAEMGMDSRPDAIVVAFTLAAALAAAAGFGLTPALASARTNVVTALKEGGLARLRGYRRLGIRNLFVVYQVAASLMLLLITGYVVVGYQRSTGIDPGFETANLYLLSLDPIRDGYSPEKSARLLEQLPGRLSQLPEVRALTIADRIPFGEMVVNPNTSVSAPGAPGESEQAIHRVIQLTIGGNYFGTLGVPLVRGREFDERDLRGLEPPPTELPAGTGQRAATPVILNETAARELFGDSDPLGNRIRHDEQSYAVIGVAKDTKAGFIVAKPVPTVYLPMAAEAFGRSAQSVTLVVRGVAGGDPLQALRRELDSIDVGLTIFNTRTMDQHVGRFSEMIQWSSMVNGGLGLFGLILSSIGLAAVTSHAVARRRKEIGIRMALGAYKLQVLRLVLKEGIVLVVVGTVLGFLGATALARAVSAATAEFARVVAVGTGDPLLLAGGPLLLATLALIACYLPARRSTKIDPLVALREE
jgi:predicted permease